MVICTLSPATANAQEIEYLNVQKKIQEQYRNGILPEDILESLNDDEVQVLINSYKKVQPSTFTCFLDLEEDPEVAYIDSLAQEYYDYYQEYGCFPEEKNIGITPFNTIDQSEYSNIIKLVGYTYTASQIAQHLVIIGLKMALSAALLFIDLLAILTGQQY